jgi:hypothetical protein
MSKSAYPLKLPTSVKDGAARLARADGVSINQFIAVAVAEKIGVIETADEFLRRRAGKSKPKDLLKLLTTLTASSRARPRRTIPAQQSIDVRSHDRCRSWRNHRP